MATTETSAANVTNAKEMIRNAAAEIITGEIFILNYKFRGQIISMHFRAPNQKRAESLGINYCRLHGYKFLHVVTFVHDIEGLIAKKMDKDQVESNPSLVEKEGKQ